MSTRTKGWHQKCCGKVLDQYLSNIDFVDLPRRSWSLQRSSHVFWKNCAWFHGHSRRRRCRDDLSNYPRKTTNLKPMSEKFFVSGNIPNSQYRLVSSWKFLHKVKRPKHTSSKLLCDSSMRGVIAERASRILLKLPGPRRAICIFISSVKKNWVWQLYKKLTESSWYFCQKIYTEIVHWISCRTSLTLFWKGTRTPGFLVADCLVISPWNWAARVTFSHNF